MKKNINFFWTYKVRSDKKWRFRHIFVAFLENINFKKIFHLCNSLCILTLMWNRVWGIKIRKVHFFTNIYYTVITTTTFSRWFDILYSTFYKQFKYVRDTYQSIYFATLNFQQVSQVGKSGCLMWVSGGKNFFFV